MAKATKMSEKQVQKLVSDKRYVFFVGMVIPLRPGVHIFATKLEYWYFPPGPRNDEYKLIMLTWQGMTWSMIGIPRQYMPTARKIADECGLQIADGVPTFVGDGSLLHFPHQGKNIFTLENKKGHPVYQNDPATQQRMAQMELQEADSICRAWVEEQERKNKGKQNN